MNPIVPTSRRHFLKTAAATVSTFNIVPRHVLGGPRFVPPSEKVNVAIIGTGGKGGRMCGISSNSMMPDHCSG
jgi:hypothetical protein